MKEGILITALIILSIICVLVLVRASIENRYRCSFCGKYKINKIDWKYRGVKLHPENIENCCKKCNRDG